MQLPVIQLTPDRRRQARLLPLVHGLRLALVLGLIAGIHLTLERRRQQRAIAAATQTQLAESARRLPDVASVQPLQTANQQNVDSTGGADGEDSEVNPLQLQLRLLDSDGNPLGSVIQTSPSADFAVGYAGPSNLMLVLDNDDTVRNVQLLHSPDTAEHVRKVLSDQTFWNQFVGKPLAPRTDPSSGIGRVDGVSGATLTSLSIAQAVLWRLRQPPPPARTDRAAEAANSLAEASANGTNAMPIAGQPPAGTLPSLRFPDPITADQLRRWFPDIDRLQPDGQSAYRLLCLDAAGQPLGIVLRTGPLDDREIGYQGPTELLLKIQPANPPEASRADSGSIASGSVGSEADERIEDAMIASSFDNQPYVGYVRQERSFWRHFRDQTVAELAEIDFDQRLIDGVSGATMTSMAAAHTLRNAAQQQLKIAQQRLARQPTESAKTAASAAARPSAQRPQAAEAGTTAGQRPSRLTGQGRWNWSLNELGTILLVLLALAWSRSRWRGHRRWRLVWQTACFGWLGLISGHLLALTLLQGWIQSGGAWRLAPGLGLLILAATLAPILQRGNLYCDHLCPHGIAQQWLRPRHPRPVPRWLKSLLIGSACCSLAFALLGTMWLTGVAATIPLAWLEPFDGYASLRLGGWRERLGSNIWLTALAVPSLILAAVSLLAARRWPMVYCRLACPTGRALDFLRRDASRHRITAVDWALLTATILVWMR